MKGQAQPAWTMFFPKNVDNTKKVKYGTAEYLRVHVLKNCKPVNASKLIRD